LNLPGSIAPNASVTIFIRGIIPTNTPSGAIVQNIAQASSPNDPDGPAVSPPVQTVINAADLAVTKTVNKTAAQPGDFIAYTITITNNGNGDAKTILVSDAGALALQNPTYTTVNAAPTGPAAWTGQLTFTPVNPLKKGESITVYISGTVPASTAPGTIIPNTAQVSSPEDPTSPVTSTPVQTVIGAADLVVSKEVSQTAAQPGDQILYKVVVKNQGTATATNVTVTDAVPLATPKYAIGADFNYATAGTTWPGTITLSTALAPNASVTIYIRGLVPAVPPGSVLQNIAQASSPNDPNGSEKSNPVQTVINAADLVVDKTVSKTAANAGDALTYTITIRNNGNATANTITLNDAGALALQSPTFTVTGGVPASGTFTGTINLIPTGGLVPNETMTVVIIGTIPATTAPGAVIPNVAQVSSPEDPTSPVQSPEVKTVIGAADLTVNKTVDKANAQVGDQLIYTLTVTNNGTANAKTVLVDDPQVTAALQNVTYTVTGGTPASGTWTGSLNITPTGDLIPGESMTVVITGRIPATTAPGTVIPNTAQVSSPQDPTSPNQSPTVQTVVGGANLSVNKTVNKTAAQVGDQLVYTITVTNNGTSSANTVTLDDPGVLALSNPTYAVNGGTPATGSWPTSGSLVITPVGGLVAGESMTITITGTIPATTAPGASLKNTAQVSSPQDPGGPKTSPTVETIIGVADLVIDKKVDKAAAQAGDILTYTLTITNNGVAAATSVKVDDAQAASELQNVSYTINGGTPTSGTWTGSLTITPTGGLVPGESMTVVITGTIPANTTAGKVISNTAQASSPQDPTSPVTSPEVNTVVGGADLVIVKAVNKSVAQAGDQLIYTITVTNNGTATANSVKVDDAQAASALQNPTFTLTGGSPASGNWTGSLNITPAGGLVSGESMTLVITGNIPSNVPAGTSIPNSAQVSSPQDPKGTKTSPTVTTVIGAADLTVFKEVSKTAAQAGDELLYKITVTNKGTATATGVTLTDALPLTTAKYNVGADFTYATSGTAWPTNNTISLPNLAPNAVVTVFVRGLIPTNTPAGSVIPNTAQASSSTDPSNPNPSNTVTTVIGAADLVVQKSVDKSAAQSGDQLRYVITVTNTGSATATSVQLTDNLSIGSARYNVGADFSYPAGGTVWPTTNTLGLGNLTAGASITIYVRGLIPAVPAGSVIENIAQASSPNDPTGPAQSPAVKTVVNAADLTVTKAVDKSAAQAGDRLTYTLTITNNGNAPANTVRLEDSVLLTNPTFTVTGGTPASGNYAGIINLIPTGGLVQNESMTVTITGIIPTITPIGTVINNVAQVSSPEDPTAPVQSPNVQTVIGAADLVVAKTVNKTAAAVGDMILYVVTVSNQGTATATNVVVNDDVPLTNPKYNIGADFAYATAGTTWPSNASITLPTSLAPGASATIYIRGRIPNVVPGAILENIAQASSPNDPTSPAQSPKVQTVVNAADLAVNKTVNKVAANVGEELVYTLTITNNGNATANTITLNDPVSISNPTFTASGATPASGSWAGSTVFTPTGGLASGASMTVTIRGTIAANTPVGTVINNTAQVISPQDPTSPVNSPTVQTVVGGGNLNITKAVDKTAAQAGDQLTYTINVTNNGTGIVNTLTIDDTNALALTNPTYALIGGTPSSGAWTGSLVVTPTAGLVANETLTLTITGTIPSGAAAGTILQNIAQVSSPQDPTGPKQSAPVQTVVGAAQLSIAKDVDKTAVQVGDEVMYRVTVTNKGTATATLVTLADAVPLANSKYNLNADFNYATTGTAWPASNILTIPSLAPN
ncbi:MAG TPA: hypothetical protein PLL64_00670, partial [Rhodothermales bacterium]|nr:hypothetical protein [Rhodothermales bacterium]